MTAMSIDGLDYRDEVVRVVDLFTTTTTASGFSFTNCLLVGPAIVVLTGSTMSNCTVSGELEGVMWKLPANETVFGAVLFDDTTFDHCRFERVGFAGLDPFLEQFRLSMTGSA